ncbi:hypothetical protein EON76_04570 [bacterium]|nr:MAG: hypothetical protein EON76_04570 [bacterium]
MVGLTIRQSFYQRLHTVNQLPVLIKLFIITLIIIAAAGMYGYSHYKQANAIVPPTTLGQLSYQKYDSHKLTDRASIAVNVANGNLILQTQDFNIVGTGPSLNVTRYFNDRATGNGQLGSHTTLGIGADIRIASNANGSATYYGPSGIVVNFPSNGSGGYTTPADYTAASLAPVAGGGWKLTFNKSRGVYTFDSVGKQIKHENADGIAINYAYNSNGTLATATDTQGRVMTFSNYSGTNIGKITDSTGRSVTYSYTNGQLTSSTDAAGNTWQYQYYDTRGNINQITDPRGYTTTLVYDNDNRVTSIKYNDFTADVTTWTYSYDNNNSRTFVTDPLNHQTRYTYDSIGRVTETLNPVGSTNSATWDANNNQTAAIDPSNYSTTFTYDALNNQKTAKNPTQANGNPGAQAQFAYTDSAHPYSPSSKTDASGNITSYTYTTNGNLSSSNTGGSGGTGGVATTYKRQGDPNGSGGTISCSAKPGQVCQAVDGNNNITTYAYDSVGNLVSVTPPSPLGQKAYTYDSISRVKTSKDGNNSLITITYDSMDRPVKLVYASDNSIINYSYDKHGNMTQRDDGSGQTLYTYDGYNRVTKIQQQGKPDLNYTYDKANNIKTEQGPGGTTTYSYDNANQISGVNQSVNGANTTFVFTDGRPTTVFIPGNITQTMTYDRAGRQTSVKAVKGSTVLTDYTATYSTATGVDTQLMQSETNNLTGAVSNYIYDSLNRLTAVNGVGTGANNFTYTYDNNGNRTQSSKNGVYNAISTFNGADQIVATGGVANGTWDAAGNQTSIGTGMAFGYNPKSQTTSITPAGGSTINATYLDSGQAGRTQFGTLAQLNGSLGLYSDTSGSTTKYYTHLPTGTGQSLGQTIGSSTYYYLNDLHGSVVKMTDGSGNVANTYTYDPYGTKLSSTGTVSNSIQYSGGYFDSATGLYKFGTRYYNSNDARWTQLDPSAESKGYVYAGNDPINNSDPSGYFDLNAAVLSAYDLGTTGAEVGTIAGCAGGAISAFALLQPEIAPALCGIGAAEGAVQGAIMLGVSGFVVGGFQGEIDNPFSH